jgi:MFS superfamily sulfate permease-like transporter
MADELRRDLIAGLTVAAISLPRGMVYALVTGVDPRFGFNSAIVVTAVASIFGWLSHLINGPTNAISFLVFRVQSLDNDSLEDFISGSTDRVDPRASPAANRRIKSVFP